MEGNISYNIIIFLVVRLKNTLQTSKGIANEYPVTRQSVIGANKLDKYLWRTRSKFVVLDEVGRIEGKHVIQLTTKCLIYY